MADEVIDVRVLGDVELTVGGEVQRLGGRRQRAVLAMLALARRRTLGVDTLIDRLWGDEPPRTARNSLQRFVADIRQALGPHGERMRTSPAGYCLWLGDDEVDLGRAEAHIAAARRAADAGALGAARRSFDAAVVEWRGEPLGGIGDADFAAATRLRLQELGLDTSEAALDLGVRLGEGVALLDRIRSLARSHPARESVWLLLARAEYGCGRHAEALDALTTVRSQLRDELGLDASAAVADLEHRILVHDPSLDADPAEVLPAQLRRSVQRPMLGRDGDVDALIGPIVDGGAGVVLAGEPGIGKTRLLAELCRRAVDAGAVIGYGRCDRGLAASYQPWREALGAGAEDGGSDEALWADGASRIELFRRVLDRLAERARVAPLVIALDDLHWADRSTVDLVAHVLRRLPEGVTVIAAARDTEPDAADLLVGLEVVAAEEAHVVRHRLAPLAPDAVAGVVASVIGDDAGLADVVERVQAETDGNPFFVTEIARHVHDRMADGDAKGSLPHNVRTVVRLRAELLGDDVSRVLTAASAFGREFEPAVLAEVVELDTDDVLAVLERAEQAGLVADAPDDRRGIAFTHDLVHHALYQELGAERRARLHRRIADALEAGASSRSTDELVEDVARHLLAADDPSVADRTLDAVQRAAARAAERHAPGEAVTLLDEALTQLDRLDPTDDARRAELLVELGVQQRRDGDARHRATLLDAAAVARRAGAPGVLVRAATSNVGAVHAHVFEIDHDEIALLEEALDAVGEEPSKERAVLLASLANQRWAPEDRDEARSMRDESLAMARSVGDPTTLVDVLIRATRSRKDPPPVDEVAALNAEAREVSRRYGVTDPVLTLNRLRSEQQHALQVADADAHDIVVGEIIRLADRYPLPVCVQSGLLAEATLAGFAGDADRYEALAAQALEVGLEVGDPEAWLIYEAQLFYARLLQGRCGELLDDVRRIAQERPDVSIYRAVLGLMLCEVGAFDDAHAVVDAQHRRGFDYFPNMIDVQELVLWGEAAAGAGHVDAAARLYELLTPHRHEFGGHLNQITQPVALTLGRCALALGRLDDAATHLDVSADIADRFRAPWMRARTDLVRGRLASVGQVGDRSTA